MTNYGADISQLRTTAPPVDRGPLLGHGDQETTIDVSSFGPGRQTTTATTTENRGIYTDNVLEAIQGLDSGSRNLLAMEMFMEMPGVYQSIDHVFTDEGELNGYYFSQAVGNTLRLAETYGPDQLGSGTAGNSEYLEILMGDPDRLTDPNELAAAFEARRSQIEAGKSSGGGGRVINYIDPVALAAAAKDAFVNATGRRGSVAEQRAFVKQIHGLQATGATGIQVGARAEAFAQSSAPAEAGAMEYSNAAQGLMQAMGLQ